MISFKKIEKQAARHHGGISALKKKTDTPLSRKKITGISDDRYLSSLIKVVFQLGFKWRLIEEKWPNFESSFSQFDIETCSMLSDDELEAIMNKGHIVKNWPKVKSVRENASWLTQIANEHGSVGRYMASINRQAYCSTILNMQKQGARVGAKTAQLWLRRMGIDSLVITEHVLMALQKNGVLSKAPSSAKDWRILQEHLDFWSQETEHTLTSISQILAFSIGPVNPS